jgi:hypothetical protein
VDSLPFFIAFLAAVIATEALEAIISAILLTYLLKYHYVFVKFLRRYQFGNEKITRLSTSESLSSKNMPHSFSFSNNSS